MRAEPRFDVYATFPAEDDFAITKLAHNVPIIVAESLAGCDSSDFRVSIIYSGWCGTTPAWTLGYPVVVVPHQDKLRMEQLEFIADQV
jgi:hypothetical protein